MYVIDKAITREICRRSFYEFFKEAWHVIEPNQKLTDNWHIGYLCDIAQEEVERIDRKEKKEHDYIINMPFRSAKSLIFSVMLHPWAWIDYPWMRFTTTSYNYSLASVQSNKSQKIIDSDWYQNLFGGSFNLRSHVRGKSKLKETEGFYENDKGGYRFVSSISGGSTGYGGDINIGDDLLNAQDAHSPAKRKISNRFWGSTYKSRVQDFDMSVFFLVGQRVHVDDPTGNSLTKQIEDKSQAYFWVNLPAENIGNIHPKQLEKYYENGLFFPKRFSREVLDKFKSPTGIGLKDYNTQINQDPVASGGNLFKREWFKMVSRDQIPKERHFDKIIRYWDTAYTEKEKNSACAFIELGLIKGKVYVLDLDFRWVEFVKQILWMAEYDGYSKVEAKASGKSSVQVLKHLEMKAEEIEIDGGDKTARGNSIAPHVENGAVHVPDYLWKKFLDDERQGILNFPDGSHDDLADVFILGITDLLGKSKHLERSNIDKIFTEKSTHVYS